MSAGYSRFHAIVAAKPLHETGPPVLPPLQATCRPTSYEPWGVRFYDGKRRRDSNSEAGPSSVAKGAKRVADDEGTSSREPTVMYQDREGLLLALRESFRQGPNVDFNGMYEMANTESVTHKERIQTVANDIWKTTGYRFTVKDHPQFTNGFKTRFWCSQDDAHRSKSSRAARKAQGTSYKPRVTSAGEAMAKARYPCRSRLLISSRDSNLPRARTCVVTVRMHHHIAHEPYIDINQPPELIQNILRGFDWLGKASTTPASKVDSNDMDHGQESAMMEEEESSEGDRGSNAEGEGGSNGDGYEPMEDDVLPQNHFTPFKSTYDSSAPVPEYHARMKAHIKNLREFCEGLEYQLQFNDYRMLDMLEQEGGSFLGLVAECLRKEGRLITTDDPAVYSPQLLDSLPPPPPSPSPPSPPPLPPPPPPPPPHHHHHHRPMHPPSPPPPPPPPPSNIGIDPTRTYPSNHGINPRALNY